MDGWRRGYQLVNGRQLAGGTGTAGVPGPTDSVVFGPAGTNTAAFVISNYVDSVTSNFGGTIGSLQYTNAAGYQNTLIAPGVSLWVTNASVATATQAAGDALMVGGYNSGTSGGATISGPGASLVVSNTNGQFIVSQAGTAATLNLSNLDTLVTCVSRLGVGVPPKYNWGVITATDGGALILAKTNYISTAFSMVPGVAISYTNWVGYVYVSGHEIEEAIEVGNGADNSIGAASSILLGLTNGFYIDSMGVGKSKSANAAAVVKFNPAFTSQSPTAWFRGTKGSASGRVAFLAIGDNATGGSSGTAANGTMDFTGGSVDAMVDLMFLGIDKNANSGAGANTGTLTFTAGSFNINALTLGAQESSTAANENPCVGIVNVSGAGATLTVNNVLELGHTAISAPTSTGPANTLGALNITNGAAYVNNIIVGALSAGNAVLVSGGALIVSNTLATNGNGLASLSLANATLGLNIPASGLPVSLTKALVTGGASNVIQILSAPVFSSYPQQIKLIKYTSLSGAGCNFGFGATPLPSSAPNAYLTNTGNSIDLVLPNDPRPVIALPEPASYSGNLGDNVNFTVLVNPASVTPLSYQWYYYNTGATNTVTDGLTADNATLSGATNATLSISNGQADENGNYFVVVTNIYGSAASSVAVLNLSQNCVSPGITGPASQTVILGNNATFTASVSANPAATIWWTRNGTTVGGATSSSLTVTNAQYPGDDQAQYLHHCQQRLRRADQLRHALGDLGAGDQQSARQPRDHRRPASVFCRGCRRHAGPRLSMELR